MERSLQSILAKLTDTTNNMLFISPSHILDEELNKVKKIEANSIEMMRVLKAREDYARFQLHLLMKNPTIKKIKKANRQKKLKQTTKLNLKETVEMISKEVERTKPPVKIKKESDLKSFELNYNSLPLKTDNKTLNKQEISNVLKVLKGKQFANVEELLVKMAAVGVDKERAREFLKKEVKTVLESLVLLKAN